MITLTILEFEKRYLHQLLAYQPGIPFFLAMNSAGSIFQIIYTYHLSLKILKLYAARH